MAELGDAALDEDVIDRIDDRIELDRAELNGSKLEAELLLMSAELCDDKHESLRRLTLTACSAYLELERLVLLVRVVV